MARDGRAPTLCWNNPGDPDGDSVTFFAEVFESAVNAPDAYEPDDERSAAQALPSGQPQARTFCSAGDHDWVVIHVQPGREYAIYTFDLGWTTDTVLTLFDAAGNVLAENDDVDYPNNLSSWISWTPTHTATLYARVRHYDSRIAGGGVTYRLVFSPLRRLHRLHLPMVRR